MATLANEYSPTVAGSDSPLVDTSVSFSLSKVLRSAFRRFLRMNLRIERCLAFCTAACEFCATFLLVYLKQAKLPTGKCFWLAVFRTYEVQSLLRFELPRSSEV